MKSRKVRNLALMLALTSLFSTANIGIANANDTDRTIFMIDKNGKLKVVDDKKTFLNKGKTFVDDLDDISIFNLNNTFSNQFGGSQSDFLDGFNNLINDPYILEEMDKCFSIPELSSREMKIDFYRLYFKALSRSGCGYVSMTNKIFQYFENREDEFEEIFGFPMYKINSDNSIDYNYELLTLKIFNFSNLYPDYSDKRKRQIVEVYAKTLADRELKRFMNSDEYNVENKKWLQLEGEEQLEYIEKVKAKKAKYRELYAKWEKAENKEMSFSMELETLGHIKEFLSMYGITIKTRIKCNNKGYKPGDIIVCDKYHLYKEDEKGKKYSEKNSNHSHGLYVVSVDNNKIIVSSWGDRYIFDNSVATETFIVTIDIVKIKNKIKRR